MDKIEVVIDVQVSKDSNIRKKEHKKLEKYQALREQLERIWEVKAEIVPVANGALGGVIPRPPPLAGGVAPVAPSNNICDLCQRP